MINFTALVATVLIAARMIGIQKLNILAIQTIFVLKSDELYKINSETLDLRIFLFHYHNQTIDQMHIPTTFLIVMTQLCSWYGPYSSSVEPYLQFFFQLLSL